MFVPATTHTLAGGDLFFDSEGFYTFGDPTWAGVSIEANFTYNGGYIGLLPRFLQDDMYMAFTIGNYSTDDGSGTVPIDEHAIALFYAQVFDDTVYLDKKQAMDLLVIGNNYSIIIKMTSSNYKVFLDNVLLFNIDYNTISQGQAAIYATQGNSCLSIQAFGQTFDTWYSNVESINGAIVDAHKLDNDDIYLYLENPDAVTELTISQDIVIAGNSTYTLSFSYIGELTARITDNTATPVSVDYPCTLVTDWTRIEYSIPYTSTTNVTITFATSLATPVQINEVQFEDNLFSTDYIENVSILTSATRDGSSITYPSEGNITPSQGALSIWIKPNVNYNSAINNYPVIFEYGTSSFIRLCHDNGYFYFTYGDTTIYDMNSGITDLIKGTWYHLVVNWSPTNIALYVNNIVTEQAGIYNYTDVADIIHIGYCPNPGYDIFNGALDDLMIYSKPLTQDEINSIFTATEVLPTTNQMTLRATFDHAIAEYQQSTIEVTPAPQYGSPVILKKDDGTVMNKVSYYDTDTGEYQPYNREPVLYDGKADYISVGSKDIDDTNFKISVTDTNGAIVGDPYTVTYDRIYLTLTTDQKAALRGSTLWATYEPKDAYSVDFNIGVADSFRVNVGKHDGQGLSVTYEGNSLSQEKLITMVDLNPLMNPNHEGFLYITQSDQLVTSFRVKATPSDLYADGISDAVVVIEPLDANGNFIGTAFLDVQATEGSMIPNYDPGSIELRYTAGRYLFKYRSPLILLSDRPSPEITDYINIKDRVSGLGVQIPITLSIQDSYPNKNAVTLEQQNWETIASYILDKVMDNFGIDPATLTDGLGALLDLDADGKIDLNEIIWLNTYKFSQDLYTKYINLVTWYQTHV